MVRISAIFTALCMVLIAASLGAALFLRFGFSLTDSALSRARHSDRACDL